MRSLKHWGGPGTALENWVFNWEFGYLDYEVTKNATTGCRTAVFQEVRAESKSDRLNSRLLGGFRYVVFVKQE